MAEIERIIVEHWEKHHEGIDEVELAKAIEQHITKAMESLQLCTRKDCDKGKALSPDGSSSVVDCPECEGRGFKIVSKYT